jgi:putative mycofactocin binding protein MftB
VRRVLTTASVLDRKLVLDPRVALRPEPFGALAYHYGNRRLVFLKHPDVVRVVQALAHHDSVADALRACGVAEPRWPAFVSALESLLSSEVLGEPAVAG